MEFLPAEMAISLGCNQMISDQYAAANMEAFFPPSRGYYTGLISSEIGNHHNYSFFLPLEGMDETSIIPNAVSSSATTTMHATDHNLHHSMSSCMASCNPFIMSAVVQADSSATSSKPNDISANCFSMAQQQMGSNKASFKRRSWQEALSSPVEDPHLSYGTTIAAEAVSDSLPSEHILNLQHMHAVSAGHVNVDHSSMPFTVHHIANIEKPLEDSSEMAAQTDKEGANVIPAVTSFNEGSEYIPHLDSLMLPVRSKLLPLLVGGRDEAAFHFEQQLLGPMEGCTEYPIHLLHSTNPHTNLQVGQVQNIPTYIMSNSTAAVSTNHASGQQDSTSVASGLSRPLVESKPKEGTQKHYGSAINSTDELRFQFPPIEEFANGHHEHANLSADEIGKVRNVKSTKVTETEGGSSILSNAYVQNHKEIEETRPLESKKRPLESKATSYNSKRAHLATDNYNVGDQNLKPSCSSSTTTAISGTTATNNSSVAKPSTRSGKSSRNPLGPALNTNLKPRARQGTTHDPQTVAARIRRERINARLKVLQELVPNGSKVDLVTMLEKAINYVKFLQLQLRVLSNDEYWQATQAGKVAMQTSSKSDVMENEEMSDVANVTGRHVSRAKAHGPGEDSESESAAAAAEEDEEEEEEEDDDDDDDDEEEGRAEGEEDDSAAAHDHEPPEGGQAAIYCRSHDPYIINHRLSRNNNTKSRINNIAARTRRIIP